MRYEVMRLLQFVFSLSLVLAAFMGGMYVGWRRWGRRGPVDHSRVDEPRTEAEAPGPADAAAPGRRDLFAPELGGTWSGVGAVDLRVGAAPTRLGLPTASGAATAVGGNAGGAPASDALA